MNQTPVVLPPQNPVQVGGVIGVGLTEGEGLGELPLPSHGAEGLELGVVLGLGLTLALALGVGLGVTLALALGVGLGDGDEIFLQSMLPAFQVEY